MNIKILVMSSLDFNYNFKCWSLPINTLKKRERAFVALNDKKKLLNLVHNQIGMLKNKTILFYKSTRKCFTNVICKKVQLMIK